ncbi:GntR family transcriptional regulator [Pararcticibacter amylolyticus]|uniref:GntR family transcriptional regulator n=1 Tax=Pararcticibacter amylolyticus TaxID=2173175 RepID=A0A2U2PJE1_9SPHI|nr:GntR family transcriptional regulator [Pararcticibacter amylolyticus]PWG81511.1 GntR family transcriptional regulator [Pararcticibacter amylolyticus]
MNKIIIDHSDKTPKVQQIINSIKAEIDRGSLKRGDKILSVADFAKTHQVARDTVEKAYRRLKDEGYLETVAGKGNYITGNTGGELRILLIFNKLSSYKKEIYYSFLRVMGPKAKVDLQIHHYDPAILKEIIAHNKGKYHYYVVMPHFFQDSPEPDYQEIFHGIDPQSIMMLDKKPEVKGIEYPAVYQDFRLDIYEALYLARHLFEKYRGITVVFPQLNHHPVEILDGISSFCSESSITFSKATDMTELMLKKGEAYITLTESSLADLLKKIRLSGYVAGKDIGVLSFNETVMKELLDITVVTSEFTEMGSRAAQMILDKNFIQVRNQFRLIVRQSL